MADDDDEDELDVVDVEASVLELDTDALEYGIGADHAGAEYGGGAE